MPSEVAPEARELKIAKQLIDPLVVDWNPKAYKNTYRERIEALIEEKREGHAIVFESERPKSNVVDLMAALEASVARAGESNRTAPGEAKNHAAAAKATKSEQQTFEG